MKCVAIIPARLHSTRLFQKVLQPIAGKPMIQWVYERVAQAQRIDQVYIATDAPEVGQRCAAFTENIVYTSPAHRSGTDRVAEVARALDAEVVVNVQGDQPLIEPALIDALTALIEDPATDMASAMTPIREVADFLDPHVVKVVTDAEGYALYFSRAPIPWLHAVPERGPLPEGFMAFKHLGVYAFRRASLLAFTALPPAPLERIERLEQLRALASGWRIRMLYTTDEGIGVDTEQDLQRVREILQ